MGRQFLLTREDSLVFLAGVIKENGISKSMRKLWFNTVHVVLQNKQKILYTSHLDGRFAVRTGLPRYLAFDFLFVQQRSLLPHREVNEETEKGDLIDGLHNILLYPWTKFFLFIKLDQTEVGILLDLTYARENSSYIQVSDICCLTFGKDEFKYNKDLFPIRLCDSNNVAFNEFTYCSFVTDCRPYYDAEWKYLPFCTDHNV